MARYLLRIEYDGAPFHGWQAQAGQASVQGALEEALFGYCGARARMTAAGRTDAGVHALGQVAHFDLAAARPEAEIRAALNFHLKPLPISVLEARAAADDFHARFSARARHYLYRIAPRPTRPALERNRVWQIPRPLDRAAMHAAAGAMTGCHDFTTFRAAQCQARSPVKTLDRLEVAEAPGEIVIHAAARSFLHHQVRGLVGALVHVGCGRWSPGDLRAALAAADRTLCPPLAPPHGLYLARVDYAAPLPKPEAGP